jgi:L-ascorbate metabolism protein UlaG (beta-lactamase superfamily)
MQLQLIRSATLRLEYAHRRFIIDPYLAAKHSRPSYTGASPNPLVDLPCSPLEAIAGIEMALISHLHSDHFDPAAQALLSKTLPILCQPGDKAAIEAMGFRSVIPVKDTVNWQGIRITRTPCQHGTGTVLGEMGSASGFVFEAENEPTVYWAGDTVWWEAVAETIHRMQPDVIVTHSCGAVWGDHVLIVMDAAQTVAVCRAAPNSTVIATHMEALDHATVTREALRKYAEAHGIGPEKLLIPFDGEEVVLMKEDRARIYRVITS